MERDKYWGALELAKVTHPRALRKHVLWVDEMCISRGMKAGCPPSDLVKRLVAKAGEPFGAFTRYSFVDQLLKDYERGVWTFLHFRLNMEIDANHLTPEEKLKELRKWAESTPEGCAAANVLEILNR
jgi:hypothetical protein